MRRIARVMPILAALLLLYSMNATAAWAALLTMFVFAMTRRRPSWLGLPGPSLPNREEG